MPWFSEMVFLGILNIYMVFSVGIEGTLGNWLYTLAGGNASSGFSQATWVNTALWGSFTLSRIFLIIFPVSSRSRVLYCASCFLGTLCGLLAVHQHPKAASRGADSDGASEEGPILDSWVLWTLTVSFGIGIRHLSLMLLALPIDCTGSFSGVTQSFFGISANAEEVRYRDRRTSPGMTGIGDVSYLVVPFVASYSCRFCCGR